MVAEKDKRKDMMMDEHAVAMIAVRVGDVGEWRQGG